MGAEELTALASQRLDDGGLPSQEPERVWGGYSRGSCCDLCAASISAGYLELEVVDASGVMRLYHLACFDALTAARALKAAA